MVNRWHRSSGESNKFEFDQEEERNEFPKVSLEVDVPAHRLCDGFGRLYSTGSRTHHSPYDSSCSNQTPGTYQTNPLARSRLPSPTHQPIN
jgi:hypothetical protein